MRQLRLSPSLLYPLRPCKARGGYEEWGICPALGCEAGRVCPDDVPLRGVSGLRGDQGQGSVSVPRCRRQQRLGGDRSQLSQRQRVDQRPRGFQAGDPWGTAVPAQAASVWMNFHKGLDTEIPALFLNRCCSCDRAIEKSPGCRSVLPGSREFLPEFVVLE